MIFCRRWLLILFALVCCGQTISAQSLTREQRTFNAAVSAFQDEMWSHAETQFAQFARKFLASTNLPQARLLQAQAQFQQQQFTNAISLLASNLPSAGAFADQYVYWIGEAQFQGGDFFDSAETFDSLAKNHPESPLALRAVIGETAALTHAGAWPRVVASLSATNGVFQNAVRRDAANELVVRGRLLLAQAKFALKDYAGASAILDTINPQTLAPALDWQRIYLLCQVKLAAGEIDEALAASTNLLQVVRLERDADSLTNFSESVAMRAGVLEKLGRTREAMLAYQENLTTNAPIEKQQQAILKIAGLSVALNKFSDATNALENFLGQFSNSPAADIALLTLGELQLKTFVAAPADTNQLAAAQASFDQFLDTFTNSAFAGQAYLDRGWCLWLAGKNTDSLNDFKMAAAVLPHSEDLAVAKFKLADAQFQQRDFPGALENYLAVWEDFTDFPAVRRTMGDRALYQSLRADLELGDLDSASNVLAQIEKNFAGEPAQNSALLFGERWAELRSPAVAREQLARITESYPDSPLRPQVALAVARTYELEKNWPAAITNYANWLNDFPTNNLRPQTLYALAQANYQAGDETNAFLQFTNFVVQFPTNGFAPAAQWWVADHFFRAGDWTAAERNYKSIFQNPDWRDSPLFWQSQMMAGRAALGRLGYSDAVGYFTGLAADTNCPPELALAARFACGSTLMLMNSTDTNNPFANFQLATNIFVPLAQANPTNSWGAQAMIEAGNSDLQMNNFDAATNAYAQVFNSPSADVSARSRAQIGCGIALEKMAAAGTNQTALLEAALDNYLAVFNGSNLHGDEQPDPFWVKKAGLQAAPLVGLLNSPGAEQKFYDSLKKSLPQLAGSIGKKIAALAPAKN
jgi:outer membrane protein assembly factor BamD (BamD/ComL family)